jgi:hypothetical protein
MNLGADMMGDQPDDPPPSAADSLSPVSASPSESRSTQMRPSGFSITSTTAGSSRNRAIDAPSAVRSIRAPRAIVSGF